MANGAEDPAYIGTGALNTTVYSSVGSAITVLGGAAVGVAKALGADMPVGIAAAALGVVAVGVLSLALIVGADMRARAAVKVAAIEAGASTGDSAQASATNHGDSPLVEVNVRRDTVEVETDDDQQ